MEPESVRKHTSLVQPLLGESAQKCTDTHTPTDASGVRRWLISYSQLKMHILCNESKISDEKC